MAKLKMKCIELLAPLEQSKEIIDCLQRMGTVELTDCEESEALCKLSTGVTVSTFERYLAAAESAQKTLNKYAPQKKGRRSAAEKCSRFRSILKKRTRRTRFSASAIR